MQTHHIFAIPFYRHDTGISATLVGEYYPAPSRGLYYFAMPVSGASHTYTSSDAWLHAMSYKELFAVRRGVLKFQGFKPKKTPVAPATLTDADFEPIFEQKGVDMRIGLDIAAYANTHAVDRIILVSGDTDCVPALKYGRRAGLQVVLVEPANQRLAPELFAHADFRRVVTHP